jgi:hypothetical protein
LENKIKHKNYDKTLYIQYELGLTNANKGVLNQTIQDLSHRPWIKQDAPSKGKVENSSSTKYVPPHRRHIKGKGNIICENANLKSPEIVKKHSNKRSLPTSHHCGITGHI